MRFLLIATLWVVSGAGSLVAGGTNFIANSGFEDGMSPWVIDNWAHNEVKVALDETNPHSGRASVRAELNKVVGAPNLMLTYRGLPLKGGMAVEIRFWARGISNVSNLAVLIRQSVAPFWSYFRAEVGLTDEWHEYVYTALLPEAIDAEHISLIFETRAVGTFWVDDVSVTEMPPVDNGPAPAINPIRNASFEAGTDGWVGMLREREFKEMWQEAGGNSPAPAGAKLEIRSDGTAPHGQKFLSFQLQPDWFMTFTSAFFPARYGRKMVLTFSLRSDGEHSFEAGIGSGKNANATFQLKSFTSSAEWKTYTVPLTLKPALGGLYNLCFRFTGEGHYDLDAVSVVEADQPAPLLYPPAVAINSAPDAPAGNLYVPKQKATFRLVVANEKPQAKLTYRITIFDYLEHKKAEFDSAISVDAAGYGEKNIQVPTTDLGAYRIEARHGATLLAEQLYSVLPPLAPPAERPDSFFGGHIDLTPYNLEIARKAGFRWIRIYQPLTTLWMVVEPSPGEWKFSTEGPALAHAQGFRLLGSLNTVPNFAADFEPGKPLKTRWRNSYPPADMNRWKEYVTRTLNAFSPYVDAWEMWNEPDGGYLQVRPGVTKEDVLMSLLKSTREALDATGKPYVLMAPAVASINAQLGWSLLNQGAGKYLDAYSFHYYSLTAGGDSPDDHFILPLLAKYRTYKNRADETLPLWHTEGGIYLAGSQSWLATYRVPPSSSVTPGQAAASMVRAALLFKAMNVKRYFDYQVGASPTGRRINEDITCGFIDVTGIPAPGIAAHAAMVALTEDAAPLGFELLPGDSRTRVAHFKSAKGLIDVYWSGVPASLKNVAALQPKDEVRDLMGNIVSGADAQTGEFPLYVLRSAPSK